MKRIITSLITSALAVSTFAATPTSVSTVKPAVALKSSQPSAKHIKKISHKEDHGNKHQKSTPTAKSLAIVK